MPRAVILTNAFAVIDTNGNRFNQFLASWEGKYFITNPTTANGVTQFRVVDKAVIQSYITQNVLTGGTAEQRYQILSKIATYDELATIRNNDNSNFLKADYNFETALVNDAMKQSTPYAEPFTLLAPSQTVATIKQGLGLITSTATGGTETAITGTVNNNANAKSILNTLTTMGDTKEGIFGGVSKAWEADPWGTAILGGSIVEVLSFAITGKTIATGALFGQKTLLLGGKGMKRKKGKR
jgi:hypothetical protein